MLTLASIMLGMYTCGLLCVIEKSESGRQRVWCAILCGVNVVAVCGLWGAF